MSASAEFFNVSAKTHAVGMAQSGRKIARVAQLFIGAALTLAALGIWIGPGATWESDVMLFKMILSLTALLAGVGMMQATASPAKAPEVEIDTIRREVRIVRVTSGGAVTVQQRCAFADLSRAERNDNYIRMWDENGQLIAEVTLSDRSMLNNLVAGLRNADKL